MKNVRTALALLLACLLLFTMVACMPVEKPDPDPTGRPAPTETMETPDPTEAPEPTHSTFEYWLPLFDVRRENEEIYAYPFTEEEMASAMAVVEAYMNEISQSEGVLTFELEKIAYCPILTEIHILQEVYYGIPEYRWAFWEYYENSISFAVTYSATHDHTLTFAEDADHDTISVEVRRENKNAEWEFNGDGHLVFSDSKFALSREELAQVAQEGEQVLGGYRLEDGTLWLYLWDSVDEKPFFVERKP